MNFEITSGGGESRGLELEIEVCRILREKGLHVATAESCTGGLLAGKITSVAGASECFECGVVTYSNEQKVKLLGVSRVTLGECGAVSPNTAVEMARGVRHLGGADIGIGITGIAGPGGGSEEKPVGLVYIAVSAENALHSYRFVFKGDRNEVREQAVSEALDIIRRQALGTFE